MHHTRLCVAAACLLATASPRLTAQNFNGVIQFASYQRDADKPDTITQMTKGSMTRIEGMSRGGMMIMNGTNRIIVLPDQKQYMELPMNFGERAGEKERAKHSGVAEKTGKTETIAGIKCDDWHYSGKSDEDKPEEGDACVAQGAGLMIGRLAGGVTRHLFGAGGKEFNDAISNGGGLLKVSENGKVTLIALRAQATSVPDAMFAPPPGYTKMDMSQMAMPHKP